MQKRVKRRFVAGAVCPKCQELDTISLYYENNVEKLEFEKFAYPGDFIFVPPFVPHQEINASKDEMLRCVLFRSGQDPVVVNLDIPEAEEHNNKMWIDDIHSKN